MPGGKCIFNELWLKNENYKEWLKPSDTRFKAECLLCKRTIDVSNMGESALKSHLNSMKHKKTEALKKTTSIKNFVDPGKPTCPGDVRNSEVSAASCSIQPETLDSSVTRNEHLKAEILWALKVLSSNYSYKSCENMKYLLQTMFPDSEIARKFSCGEKKCAYLSVVDIAPYFSKLLKEKVKSENGYVLLFDESLNDFIQSKQLDCHIRLWDGDTIATRYYTSDFLGHSTADILFEKINDKCLQLGSKELVQLSMDGPNVNWKVYEKMFEHMKQEGNTNLLNVGSCGLHTMHNAFKAGCAVFPEVENAAYAFYRFFKDSTARREDYLCINENARFPLKFCKHRWVENARVFSRLLEILPFVNDFVSSVKSKKFPDPKNKTFETIKSSVNDELFIVKCNFIIYVAKEVEPFLTLYQTDKTMMPFLAGDLYNLIKCLMKMFLKEDELPGTHLKLLEINVEEPKIQKDASEINVGFISKRIIRELLKEKKISVKQQMEFYNHCREFLVKMVKKLLEKCPLNFSLVRSMSCLDPRTLVENQKVNMKKMSNILITLTNSGRINETVCDPVLKQYNNFIETFSCMDSSHKYKSCIGNVFDPAVDDVSTFFYDFMARDSKYSDLWMVLKTLLLLSHGQATVERGFSVNKNLMCENLSTESLIAKRIIDDFLRNVGGIEKVVITKELLLSCAAARQKYQTYLDDKRREKENKPDVGEKRKRMLDEIDTLKKKRRLLENDISELEKSSIEYADKAEKTGQLTLIAKSNALRRSALEKKQLLKNLNNELDNACLNIKNC